ncbi:MULTISPECIES: Arc family DNA-binding protein [Arsenophonus]|uniref:Arc family DNA-binding protein n=2 Tax=Arsenophonus TaxID=637 RepID=A0AA95GKS6_9GAMM|nr:MULTISPECIES: Arc family DNA-binding protein [Arsenophonus]WGM00358.1 Arc family DNA-binding protein [Arsenophonus nasoniae]WGM01905.1 Arc family DNA-binding protein [Arsenophonus nasoniae]WGO82292.1 Arc family DNA-binding protein [Arsenophonus apicola]
MKGMRSITPFGVRMPDDLKEKLTVRAAQNGRSLNSEIVMILQSAVNETSTSKTIESIAKTEADKIKEALEETLTKLYNDKK